MDKKRKVLSLSPAGRAGGEKRSSYWWLSRRWALGFAELSSLKASRLWAERGHLFPGTPRGRAGVSDPGPTGQQASGVDPRPGQSSCWVEGPRCSSCPRPTAPPRSVTGAAPGSHSQDIELLAERSPPRKGRACQQERQAKCYGPTRSFPGAPSRRRFCGCPVTSTLTGHCPLEKGTNFIRFQRKF